MSTSRAYNLKRQALPLFAKFRNNVHSAELNSPKAESHIQYCDSSKHRSRRYAHCTHIYFAQYLANLVCLIKAKDVSKTAETLTFLANSSIVTWKLISMYGLYLLCFDLYLSSAKKQNKITTSPHLAAQAFLQTLGLAAELLDCIELHSIPGSPLFQLLWTSVHYHHSDPSNRFKTSELHPTLVQRQSHTSFNERQLILYSNIVHGVMRGAAQCPARLYARCGVIITRAAVN
jgi:hypothetical protein